MFSRLISSDPSQMVKVTALSELSLVAKRHPVASFSRGHRSFDRRVLTGESNRAPDAGASRRTSKPFTTSVPPSMATRDASVGWDKSPKGPRG